MIESRKAPGRLKQGYCTYDSQINCSGKELSGHRRQQVLNSETSCI
jgi:hypothetical protein